MCDVCKSPKEVEAALTGFTSNVVFRRGFTSAPVKVSPFRHVCGSGPFSAGSGSSKSEFLKPDPDPTGAYQESIQTSNFFFTSNLFLLIFE